MSLAPIVKLDSMVGKHSEFLEMLSTHPHAFVMKDGSFVAMAHRVESFAGVWPVIDDFAERELCPVPGEPSFGAKTVEQYWDNLVENVAFLNQNPRAIAILTKHGVPAIVLQNFVANVDEKLFVHLD